MGKSKISYLTDVWSPISGCSGKNCQANCYAREMIKRFPAIHGWDEDMEDIPFNKVQFHPSRLSEPLHWRKPRVVGVGFFGDFFDEQVHLLWQHQVYEVIKRCSQHQFIILTKQAVNMRDRLEGGEPLPNVWHGTTITGPDDLWRAEELLKLPGKKWLSLEPMLGPISLRWLAAWDGQALKPREWNESTDEYDGLRMFNGLVVGAESGPKRRQMPLEWAKSIVDQCQAAGVPVYIKQIDINGKVSHNPEEWPEELRLRDLPWRKA